MMSPRSVSVLRAEAASSEQAQVARPGTFAPGQVPSVWVLASPRAGERTQLLGLAEAMGCPFEIKHIAHRRFGSALELLGGEHLRGIDRERSDALEAPWPDLVLLAHQSNENVARWIRRQSGGRTRLVLLGRPWAPVDDFDLVVTTPQYDLPEAANVLHNPLPLHRVSAERLACAGAKWEPRLAHLPRPFVTVLVGGSSGPYVFDEVAAARLGREASELARSLGGSVLISTSARTDPAAVDALFAAVDAPACLHRWSAGDSQNPYFGFLALADRIVVTADSISMVAEACATGKQVEMFAFGSGAVPMRDHAGVEVAEAPSLGTRLRGWLYELYMQLPQGRLNRSRDLRIVHRALLATGRVSWLGEPATVSAVRIVGDEMTRTLNRLRGLLNFPARPAAAGAQVAMSDSAAVPA